MQIRLLKDIEFEDTLEDEQITYKIIKAGTTGTVIDDDGIFYIKFNDLCNCVPLPDPDKFEFTQRPKYEI